LHAKGVRSVTFVSKESSLKALRKKFPEMVKGLSKNPFPDEINVTFDTPNDAKVGALRLRRNPSVNKANAPVDCS